MYDSPTLLVAIWVTWKMRQDFSELTHNLAICFWILFTGAALEWVLVTSVILILLFSICGYLEFEQLLVDLFSHFRVQYFFISGASLIIFLFLRRWRIAALCLLSCALNLAAFIPYLAAASKNTERVQSSERTFRFMAANVFTANENYNQVIQRIKEVEPDFLLVLEINKIWQEHLTSLKDIFPYGKTLPRRDNFGIAFFSKHPLDSLEIRPLGNGMTPSVLVKASINGRPFAIIGTHTLPPASFSYFNERNRQLEVLAKLSSETKEPLVVMGDLNTTMWSAAFRKLLRNSTLHDTRKGFGILPTWSNKIPPMWIPIDHALVSSDWRVSNIYTVPLEGSDHSGIVLEANL